MNRFIRYLFLTAFGVSFLLSLAYHLMEHPNIYFLNHADWRLQLSWAGAARNTMMEYGQLPAWNPYRCGGVAVIGEPESNVISPFLPFLIALGPLAGYMAFFIINFAVGCFGFYKLGKQYGLSTHASVLASQVYMTSGLYLLPFFVGMTNFLSVAYLPFVFLYYEKYLDNGRLKHAIGAAFFAALMFLSGFHYIPIVLLYILLSATIHCIQSKNFRELLKFASVASLFTVFSAVKFFPGIELLLQSGPVTYGY